MLRETDLGQHFKNQIDLEKQHLFFSFFKEYIFILFLDCVACGILFPRFLNTGLPEKSPKFVL